MLRVCSLVVALCVLGATALKAGPLVPLAPTNVGAQMLLSQDTPEPTEPDLSGKLDKSKVEPAVDKAKADPPALVAAVPLPEPVVASAPVLEKAPEVVTASAPPAPEVAALKPAQVDVSAAQSSCPKCKPQVTKACKGHIDACRNETECCELDKCNIWTHTGRDVATLLVFYVSWCPVSRDFMLPYDLLRSTYEPFTNVLVAKIDGDQNPNLVTDFGIDEFPSILFFRRDCYWSASGCNDPMAFRKYNGTSNDFDDVNQWVQQQLYDEHNENAYKSLPETSDSITGCKVGKVTQAPLDMQEPFKFPADAGKPLLAPKVEGASLLVQTKASHLRGAKSVHTPQRPSCRI